LEVEYRLYQSDRFFLLSSMEDYAADQLIGYAQRYLAEIDERLGPLSSHETRRIVLIAFHDLDHYYRYLAHFFDDEDFGSMLATYLDDGYPHIVSLDENLARVQPAVLHELVKSRLRNLPLPRWLLESLARQIEFDVSHHGLERFDEHFGADAHPLDGAVMIEIADFFAEDPQRVQDFWAGRGFDDAESQGHHFFLASKIWASILAEATPASREAFIREASSDDAGFVAARLHLDLDLGDRMAHFLGDGDYSFYLEPTGDSGASADTAQGDDAAIEPDEGER
ncbi:MAG: hypothetical protein KC609_20390, partial [Myxococcales bacterium]|nr:hypothetical protein [Myxococcales bacterium]